jgi:hypothetical protein
MARINGTAEQEIKTLLTNWWMAVNSQLAEVTGALVQIGEAPVDMLFASEIGQRLSRIARVAEAIDRAEGLQTVYTWSEEIAGQILDDCDSVETWLNLGPFSHKTPEAFWASPVGYMILRAKVWAHQDHLITLSTAAELSGMSLSVLSQRMTRGQLPGYRDPNIKNPKHGRRVRLSDLQILINNHSVRNPLSTTLYLMPQASRIPTLSPSRST